LIQSFVSDIGLPYLPFRIFTSCNRKYIRLKIGNIGFVVLINLIIKPLWLGTEFYLQDHLGHTTWGTYTALSAFALALVVFTDFGINQYTIKSLAGDTGKFKSWFPGLLGFKLLLLVVYPLLLAFGGWLMGYSSQQLSWLLIIAFSFSALHLIQFLRSVFQAFQHFRMDAMASSLDKFLLMGMSLAFIYSGSKNFNIFLILLSLSAAISLLIFLVIVFRRYQAKGIHLKFQFIRRIVKLSFPFALISVVYAVHDKVDKVMLDELAGPYVTGLYAAASRWVDALMMYTWIIMGLYYARFAKFAKDPEACRILLKKGQALGAIPMIPAFLVLFFAGTPITSMLLRNSTPEELNSIQDSLVWLALSTVVNSTFVIYSTYLTACGYERKVTRMVALSIVLKVLINFIFIPAYGGKAAALASLISFTFLSALYIWLTQVHSALRIPYKELLYFGLSGLACFILGYILQPYMSVIALMACVLGLYAGIGIGAGFLRPAYIRELMQ